MGMQYKCINENRRELVRHGNSINGIDYLEVSDDQKHLMLHFIHNLPGSGENDFVPDIPDLVLNKENIIIEGGVRIKDIYVISVSFDINEPKVLIVEVNEPGDFSTYTLRLVKSPDETEPPKGFDPQLAAVGFSFKVTCPSAFDCKSQVHRYYEALHEPQIDYMAKDYATFRRLMLDRISAIMPEWRERNPADMQVALVELLAYIGDHLSYYQDAVGTEAYLDRARKRLSVRRHARLLDYYVHEGCNARAWINFEVKEDSAADGKELPKGIILLSRATGSDNTAVIATQDLGYALSNQPVVFETMHKLELHSAHNRISFYTWGNTECCLPRGSTCATLLNRPALSLKPGDVLIFQELIDPVTGMDADADHTHRHAVRLRSVITKDSEDKPLTDPLDGTPIVEIEWYEEDALPFPLCITQSINNTSGVPELKEVSIARGNVVLADSGLTITDEPLDPDYVPDEKHYRPRLQQNGLIFSVPYDEDRVNEEAASNVFLQDPRRAVPFILLKNNNETWTPMPDLLGSDPFATEFVVEMENDGVANLRFGDDIYGKRPAAGSLLLATYRVGNGDNGNVDPETITRVVSNLDGITRVENLLPAAGGRAPEGMEEVRLFAPRAFRTQERAVIEADYAEIAKRHHEVQRALASFRWTGSWYTVFVTIDRKGGLPVAADTAFKNEIRNFLEQYRIAGYDLEIQDPVYVPLEIVLMVCVDTGYLKSHVEKALLEAFSCYNLPMGRRGFFHPDNFTFGQTLYLSQIYKTALEIEGVSSVRVECFKRWGKKAKSEIQTGFLKVEAYEIIQLDNDPNFPENGSIEFKMGGGI